MCNLSNILGEDFSDWKNLLGDVGIWMWDFEKDELYWSEAMYRLFDRDPNKVVKTFADFALYVHPFDLSNVSEKVSDSTKGNFHFDCNFRIVTNGKMKYIRGRGEIKKINKRKFLVGSNVDITNEFLLKLKLKRENDLLDDFFNESPIGMAIVAPNGKFLKINRKLEEIVGYSEAELLKLTFQDITHPEDLGKDLSYVQSMLDGNIKSYSMKKRYIHKNGAIVTANLYVVARLKEDLNGNQKVDCFFSQIEDISEKEISSKKLTESIKGMREILQEKSKNMNSSSDSEES